MDAVYVNRPAEKSGFLLDSSLFCNCFVDYALPLITIIEIIITIFRTVFIVTNVDIIGILLL